MVLSEKIEINVVFPEQFGGIYAVTGDGILIVVLYLCIFLNARR